MSRYRSTHPLQLMADGLNASLQTARAESQMTLGGLIAALEALSPERRIVGFGAAMSYRGYYCDLSFEPSSRSEPVSTLLERCRGAMGKVFQGYKGGDFQMGEGTPVWIAAYGSGDGDRVMSLNTGSDPVAPVTAKEKP